MTTDPEAVPAAEPSVPEDEPAVDAAAAKRETIFGPPPDEVLATGLAWWQRWLMGLMGLSISVGVLIFVLYILERLRDA